MSTKLISMALCVFVAACTSFSSTKAPAQAQDPSTATHPPMVDAATNSATTTPHGSMTTSGLIVYEQPINPTGVLLQSSWWDPNGSDYDQYVWDDFTLLATQVITEVQWRGGFDPAKSGSGGPVTDFSVAIYASIAGGSQPVIGSPPLVQYQTGGNAGQTVVGKFGNVTMYDYHFALPTPFTATLGTKYWLQIEATQQGIPDWGIALGTGGDNSHFRRISNAGDIFYQTVPGDATFTLLRAMPDRVKVYVPLLLA